MEGFIERFDRDGFIVIDDFFKPEELEDFQQALSQIIYGQLKKAYLQNRPAWKPESFAGREFNEGLLALEDVNHSYVADVYDIAAQTPAFLRIVGKREVTKMINLLLKREHQAPLYTFTNRCRIDPPKDTRRTYGWHQEVFYTIPKSSFLQTWAPLVRDTTAQNGTIEVRVSSHKSGIPSQTWEESPHRALQVLVDQAEVEKYPARVLEMKLGQLLIFSGHLFHRSGNNTSNEVRYSLVGMYHDPDQPEFRPAGLSFGYRKLTPKEYFDEVMSKNLLDL